MMLQFPLLWPEEAQRPRPSRVEAPHESSAALSDRFARIRKRTLQTCDGLVPEDFVIQSAPEVSPPKWHLAHTTWFFEYFVLGRFFGVPPFSPRYHFLFNSYYESAGEHLERPLRGLLSRPSLDEVLKYRRTVDERVLQALSRLDTLDTTESRDAVRSLVQLGLEHEQQHQELLYMDIKHNLWRNPLQPAYASASHGRSRQPRAVPAHRFGRSPWIEVEAGLYEVGHAGKGFAFDNESPRHTVYLHDFKISSALVTNGEYLKFMEAGGYESATHWLSDGWAIVQERRWNAPLYWAKRDGQWGQYSLVGGWKPLDLSAPVCHVSLFEADAYARWRGARLPTEFEWEIASSLEVRESGKPDKAGNLPANLPANFPANFMEDGWLEPRPSTETGSVFQFLGDVWEWTSSPYAPYPGFKPLEGQLAEYNGKFMCNQFVLRGGCCVTPRSHIRATYRNFFAPQSRWQFAGFRIAKD